MQIPIIKNQKPESVPRYSSLPLYLNKIYIYIGLIISYIVTINVSMDQLFRGILIQILHVLYFEPFQ